VSGDGAQHALERRRDGYYRAGNEAEAPTRSTLKRTSDRRVEHAQRAVVIELMAQ
jgi:hypothetical protein